MTDHHHTASAAIATIKLADVEAVGVILRRHNKPKTHRALIKAIRQRAYELDFWVGSTVEPLRGSSERIAAAQALRALADALS